MSILQASAGLLILKDFDKKSAMLSPDLTNLRFTFAKSELIFRLHLSSFDDERLTVLENNKYIARESVKHVTFDPPIYGFNEVKAFIRASASCSKECMG